VLPACWSLGSLVRVTAVHDQCSSHHIVCYTDHTTKPHHTPATTHTTVSPSAPRPKAGGRISTLVCSMPAARRHTSRFWGHTREHGPQAGRNTHHHLGAGMDGGVGCRGATRRCMTHSALRALLYIQSTCRGKTNKCWKEMSSQTPFDTLWAVRGPQTAPPGRQAHNHDQACCCFGGAGCWDTQADATCSGTRAACRKAAAVR
jgi:hypothetical protein